eukprot:TRINITY_DN968_c0_g1_i3.p2 TRINITY_DN968_c0_g1~~TRINITY_DN968_c0_g1_i3.p2  ORF type:complete len:120 (-),score=26.34 TRINITY_DN968_c0_g1_i3:200-508(-)
MALVATNGYGGRCDTYCQSFGQECAAAYEESGNSCTIKQTYKCDEAITGTSDMLCKCVGAAPQPITSPPTTAAPASTSQQPGFSCKAFEWQQLHNQANIQVR